MKKLFFISFLTLIFGCVNKVSNANYNTKQRDTLITESGIDSVHRDTPVKIIDTPPKQQVKSRAKVGKDTTIKQQRVKIIHSHLSKEVEDKKTELNKTKFKK